jgi:very-short-patch-repair endonuclease
MQGAKDLLVGLLDYIQEQAKIVKPEGFRLSALKGLRYFPADLSLLPGLTFNVETQGDHIWLRVERLEPQDAPVVRSEIHPYVSAAADPYGRLPELDVAEIKAHLDQNPKVDAEEFRQRVGLTFDEYSTDWTRWAEREKPRRQSIEVYGHFFTLKHQIEAEETAKPQELVWGVGIASWLIPSGGSTSAFEYPLLTQAVEISIDKQSMAIELRPRETDVRLELDAFVLAQIPGTAETELAAKAQLASPGANGFSPFDVSSYSPVMRLVAGNLDSNGSYREVLSLGQACPPPGDDLIVTDGWVLLARPRQNNFLLEDLKRLKEKVAAAESIPFGPLALVTPPSDVVIEHISGGFRGLSSGGRGGSGGPIQELYFPLPHNDEQVTIIERLEHAPGVTVQGPPGTGKTHTIANVICHYLATGRRVLVTSRGEPALEVLQAKLPDEVRPLTVALLATDREGVRQFQASIEAIQHQVSQLNVQATEQAIGALHTAIDRIHHELVQLDARVNVIAMAQLGEITLDGENLRAQKAAELLLQGATEHGWFDDEITIGAEHQPPLTEDEAANLRHARRQVGADLTYLGTKLPQADQLPAAAQVAELHRTITSLRHLDEELATAPNLALLGNTREVHDAAAVLLKTVQLAQTDVAALEIGAPTWGQSAREKCRSSSYLAERRAFEAMFGDIEDLVAARADFLKRPVVFPVAGFASPKTLEAVKRAADTGKPFGAISIGAGEAKKHISDVRVSGLPPQDADAWNHVQKHVQMRSQLSSFVARWNTFAEALSLPTMAESESDLRKVEKQAVLARNAHRIATFLDKQLINQSSSVFCVVPAEQMHGNAKALADIEGALRKFLSRTAMARAAEGLTAFQEQVADTEGTISQRLRDFASQMLGKPAFESEQVATEYVHLMAELRRVHAVRTHLHVIHDSAQRLRDAGAVRWADRIVSVQTKNSGDDETVPARWRKSWTWARVRGHLEAIEGREELRALAEKRISLGIRLQKHYCDLVGKSAWLRAKRNATPRILSALNGYATAIRRIGQGTGPNATRYRRDARDAMTDAAGAVPCWIMSHARISESMPAEIGGFDLVIVDEASQSDLWALPAILRGKKILVVGDDKQVSPDGGFINSEHITSLRARFLGQQPYGADMTPEKSLYDLAARVFAGHQVMLREHFRCVAPIIAYSNHTFYRDAIQPLRIPLASERLDPPLIDVYVPSGLRDRKDQNHHEALAIADEIEAILADPAMAGRTLGVVSLLGLEQARHVDEVVRERCSAAELMRRKFECGDARTFQGSERDIMFLSVVADRERHHALSGTGYEQRFNVAASRARDRMYLVRSVQLSDLSEVDLRKTLLDHFDKPILQGQRSGEDLIGLCESGFEKEVYLKLVDKGYRVIPQVKVGAYRIDMVVEGAEDRRLAIELDGDEFHGPDRWAHDMNRQRILERAGWSFWRCFASTWSLHTEEVFDELLSKLSSMHIEPIGALAQIPMLVEHRVWEQPAEVAPDEEVTVGSDSAGG